MGEETGAQTVGARPPVAHVGCGLRGCEFRPHLLQRRCRSEFALCFLRLWLPDPSLLPVRGGGPPPPSFRPDMEFVPGSGHHAGSESTVKIVPESDLFPPLAKCLYSDSSVMCPLQMES